MLRRQIPSSVVRKKLIRVQKNRCIYCGLLFGDIIRVKNRAVTLKVNLDHFIPYSFTCNNRKDNFVASCQVCNGIKSNKHFSSIKSAQSHILKVRASKMVSPISAKDISIMNYLDVIMSHIESIAEGDLSELSDIELRTIVSSSVK